MLNIPVIGTKFGKLEIQSFTSGRGNRGYITTCKCECGNISEFYYSKLKQINNCGCKTSKLPRIGQRFTNLTILSINKNNNKIEAKCICDCGKEVIVNPYKLTSKHTKSCGCRLYYKKHPNDIAKHEVFQVYRSKAKERGINFSLSEEESLKLFTGNCYYCGIEPSTKYSRKKIKSYYKYNGIDRLDSTKGYHFDNVVSCCTQCNWMKNKFSLSDFFNKIKLIYERHLKNANI